MPGAYAKKEGKNSKQKTLRIKTKNAFLNTITERTFQREIQYTD